MRKKDIKKIIKLFSKPPELKIISLKTTLKDIIKSTGLSEKTIIDNIIEINNINGSFILEYNTDEKIFTKSKQVSELFVYRHYYNNKLLKIIMKTKDNEYISINDFQMSSTITYLDGKISKIFKYKDGKTEIINFNAVGSLDTYKISKYKNCVDSTILNLKINNTNIEFNSGDKTIIENYDD